MSTSQNTSEAPPTHDATADLFAFHDFIRPGEQPIYSQLDESLRQDLAPQGILEHNLVDEIRRAMWRLRRCGIVEEGFSEHQSDPMQEESTAELQLSVDRARALSHRLLHKCTAELRKLQTERQFRNEFFKAGTDISHLGVSDVNSVQKAAYADRKADLDAFFSVPSPTPTPPNPGSFCKTAPTPPQTPRNAPCPCGSGQKHKRCCGKDAPAVLHAA